MIRRPIVLLAAVLAGCAASRPILYPNEKYREVGQAGVDRDIAECKALANQAGATPEAVQGGQVAKSAGVGTVAGAAAGAAGGAIWGNAGVGAASGAVSGLVGGLLWPLLGSATRQPSGVHVNYVTQCLTDRGYQVSGWK